MNVSHTQSSAIPPRAPEIRMIPVLDIVVGERLRVVDDGYARQIADSMAEVGQKTPIEVHAKDEDGKYRLISGAHRVRAAQMDGGLFLHAIILDVNPLQARLHEIDENLYRRELTALDRAAFLVERKEVYDALNPGEKRGGDRRPGKIADSATLPPRFTIDIAEKFGLSERSVQVSLARYRKIDPAARKRVVGTPLADNGSELDALARLSPDHQARVLDLLEEHEFLLKVAAAHRTVLGAKPVELSDEDRLFVALLNAWRKAGTVVRRRFEEHQAQEREIASTILPAKRRRAA